MTNMNPEMALGYREHVRKHWTGLVRLLFTDAVGPTALKQRLG